MSLSRSNTWNFDPSRFSRCLCVLLLLIAVSGCSSDKNTDVGKSGSGNQQGQVVDSARPALTNLHQVGPNVDLLALIDPERDTVRGDFRFEEGELVFSGSQVIQLNFDVDVPEQYELLMAVAREEGDESLNIGLHVGGATTLVVIEGWGKKISGLNLVDGKFGEDNVTSSEFSVFDDGSSKMIRVIVRRESVLVDVDGSVFIDFRGTPSRLSFDDRFFRRPSPGQLMVGGWDSSFRISSWVLKPLGEQRVDYVADSPATKAPSSTVAKLDRDEDRPAVGSGNPVASNSNQSDVLQSDLKPDTKTDPIAETPLPAGNTINDPETSNRSEPPSRSFAWSAVIDPSPHWQFGAAEQIQIPISRGWTILPEGRSHFFAAGEPADDASVWSVFDLRKGKSVGSELRFESADRGNYQLSESGEYVRSYLDVAHACRVEVHSFVSGELVYSADSHDLRIWNHPRDFLTARNGMLSFRDDQDHLEIRRIDLKTGDTTCRWRTEFESRAVDIFSVSPGGRYLVVNAGQELYVYDLPSTEIVGRLRLPIDMEVIQALAFATDGAELAVLGSHVERPSQILWCIDWKTGQTLLTADVGEKLEPLRNNYVLGPALEWFPDNTLLLFYGRDVIDRKTGKFCYRIPGNAYWTMPRRAISQDTILAMMLGDDPNTREYRTAKINRQQLENSLSVVRAGGIAQDIGLPPLTIPDATTGTTLALPDDAGPLSIQPQPSSEFPAATVKLPMRLLRSREFENKLQRIQFASADAAIAVAHFHVEQAGDGDSREMVVRYDLKRGKPTNSIQIREDFRLADVSPSGNLALLGLFNDVGSYSRVDVVDLTDKSHIAGWRPFSNEPFKKNVSASGQPAAINPQTADWVRFVDEDRVLTINPSGKLICWKLPECVAIYSCENFGQPYDLSARRRYLAGSDGKSIQILDVQTGVWAGQVKASETPQDILRVAFEPTCKELVAILAHRGRREIVFWDLNSGQVLEQFDLNYVSVSPGWDEHAHSFHRQIGLQFKRHGFLLLDDLYLIDRQRRSAPWLYNLQRAKHAANEPDRREWFAQHVTTNDNGQVFDWVLTAVDLPSEEVMNLVGAQSQQEMKAPLGRSILAHDGERATRD